MNSSNSTVTIPLPDSERIIAQIEQLTEALQKQAPGYESLLHIIHRNLAEDPETSHLLTDEQVGIICAGLTKKAGVVLAEVAVKKIGKKGGKVALAEL